MSKIDKLEEYLCRLYDVKDACKGTNAEAHIAVKIRKVEEDINALLGRKVYGGRGAV